MLIYILFMFLNVSLISLSESDIIAKVCKKVNISHTLFIKLCLVISCLMSVTFIAMRDVGVADDTDSYYQFFMGPYSGFAEYGFYLLTKFIRFFTNNFHVYLFITSMIAITPIYFLISKVKNNKWVYIFLYHTFILYIFNFAIIRQCIAMGIVALGIYFLGFINASRIKRVVLYVFLILCATMFHKIALFMLPVFLFDYINLDKRKLIIIVITTLLLVIFKNHITNFVFTIIIPNKAIYLNESTGIENFGFIPFLVFTALSLLTIYLKNNKVNVENEQLLIKLNYYFMYINIFFFWFPAYGRVLQFGYLNATFLLGSFLNLNILIRSKAKYFIVIFMIIFYIYMLTRNPYHVIPYVLTDF